MSGCPYCENNQNSNQFSLRYARRVRSILTPWKFMHIVNDFGIESTLLDSYTTSRTRRVECTAPQLMFKEK